MQYTDTHKVVVHIDLDRAVNQGFLGQNVPAV